MTAHEVPDPVQFEAVIVPHRSLGPAGLRWLIGSLLILSGAVSAGLWWAGAWPVLGFSGAEILLAIWLVRRNARGARSAELLLLSDSALRIVRTDAAGRRWERTLQPYWVDATLRERPGRAPTLMLRDRARRIEVGAALGEDEKRQLAAALREALDRHRNPVFDNPQLRPPATGLTSVRRPQDPST